MRTRLASHVASFALACALALCGCSGNPNVTQEKVTFVPLTAKKLLLQVSETGEIGSGSSFIRGELEKLKATDAATANELIKDLNQLERTSHPAQVRAIAKKMADKL